MPIDVAKQDRYFAFRLDGVTAAFEERGGERGCLLRTLTNTRPTPATVVVRLPGGGGGAACFAALSEVGGLPTAGGGLRSPDRVRYLRRRVVAGRGTAQEGEQVQVGRVQPI